MTVAVTRANRKLLGIEFRLLHICEFRDGKISRENVWLDAGSLARQLQA